MGLSSAAAGLLLRSALERGSLARYARIRSLTLEGRRLSLELDLQGEMSPVSAWADCLLEGDYLVVGEFFLSRPWMDKLAHDLFPSEHRRWKLPFLYAGLARMLLN